MNIKCDPVNTKQERITGFWDGIWDKTEVCMSEGRDDILGRMCAKINTVEGHFCQEKFGDNPILINIILAKYRVSD